MTVQELIVVLKRLGKDALTKRNMKFWAKVAAKKARGAR